MVLSCAWWSVPCWQCTVHTCNLRLHWTTFPRRPCECLPQEELFADEDDDEDLDEEDLDELEEQLAAATVSG